MINFLLNNLLWQDGKFIGILLLLAISLSFYFYRYFLILLIPALIFCLYFFRNPERGCPEKLQDNSVLICPADGKVVDISKGDFEGYSQKISIFLSPLDVHVNWSPEEGVVQKVCYRPGKFVVAYAPKSSDINERNDIIIDCKNGKTILVRQIAGIVARRICCWVEPKQELFAGQKIGMIRFGSRVDVFLPENVKIEIEVGQKVKGGQTVLGRWV